MSTHAVRSEEHTSELHSRGHLVCRLLLEKKKHQDLRHQLPYKTDPARSDTQTYADPPPPLRTAREEQVDHLSTGDQQFFFLMIRQPQKSTLYPYTPLFR